MATSKQSFMRISRRDMLKLTGAAAAGGLLAACAPPPTATQEVVEATVPPTVAVSATEPPLPTEAPAVSGPIEGHVVVMKGGSELTQELADQFTADNPGITIELLEADTTRFYAMLAAGAPPDMMRTQAPAIPQYLARKMLYNLTPYFEVSEVLHLDDLAPANNYYRANSPLDVGDGPIYGMCKDWSPDFTTFIYKPAFADAGVAIPDDTQHMTYQDVAGLAAKLAKFEGDRVLMWGYGYDAAWIDRMWMNMLAEKDLSLYKDDFTKIDLTGNDEIKAVTKWYFDLAQANLTVNPVNPSPSWIGEDFTKGTLAMCQYGFWFGGMAESDITRDQAIMLPTATWAGVPRDPTMTATGSFISAATKVPDAAWKVFEWYMSGQPALDRAASGWGVPALKSLYNLIPQGTEFEKQKFRVLQAELALETTPLRFNPFLSEGAIPDSWSRNLEQALLGAITFDDCLANVEAEVNTAIQDGVSRIG